MTDLTTLLCSQLACPALKKHMRQWEVENTELLHKADFNMTCWYNVARVKPWDPRAPALR
jgi:hypothetical protein